MELNDCINFQLNSAHNAVFSYFKTMLTPFDVTPIQYALLKCLWTEDMQPPTMLAQSLQLDTSTVTGHIDRLEKKGLIERVYNTHDRRSIHVHLLESGAALQKPIEDTILKANKEVSAGIAAGDLKEFKRVLRVIEDNAKTIRNT